MKGNVISVMTTVGSPVGYLQCEINVLLTPNLASERQHGSLYPISEQHTTH